MNTNINKIINDYIEYATQKNNIDAIVLSGSQTSLINDNMSDYDIYVYSKEKVNIEMREYRNERKICKKIFYKL